MNITFDVSGLDRITADLSATQAQADAALRSTLGRMSQWLSAKSLRGLSAALAVQPKVLRRRLKRFRLTPSGGGGEVRLWYGLDPIALVYLKPRKRAAGVSAMGGRYAPGGFIARASGKGGGGKGQQVFKRTGKARLPIEKVDADIQIPAQKWLEDELLGGGEFENRFMSIYERELKWRMR